MDRAVRQSVVETKITLFGDQMFAHFHGSSFQCIRCGGVQESWIQTHLFDRKDVSNANHFYRVGDVEIMTGVEDYLPLHARDANAPLVLALGGWSCNRCLLWPQWAKASLLVDNSASDPTGTILAIETLVPRQSADFDGINGVDEEMAEMLSGLWNMVPFDWPQGQAAWNRCSVEQRCSLMAAGFRDWSANWVIEAPTKN